MVFSRLCGILLFQDLLGSYGRGIRVAYRSHSIELIDQVRRIAPTLHVAERTEEAYVGCLHVSEPSPKSTWKMSPI
jgi:hypothetical protein